MLNKGKNVKEPGKDIRRVRSYVLRQGRMSKAQQHAYDELLPLWAIPFGSKLDRDTLGWDGPVILEIGFGMGHATAEIAASRPGTLYLASEVHKPGVGALLLRIGDMRLKNIRIIQQDAIEVMQQMIAPGLLSGLHLFFPDPWPKKRHHKRRIFQASFLEMASRCISPSGYLYAVTDWEDYAQEMLQLASESRSFTNPHPGYAEPLAWRPRTSFERKGMDKQHQIREIYLIRN